MKMESFERCTTEKDFDSTEIDNILQKMSEHVQKDITDEDIS